MSVIVREASGAGDAPERAVSTAGGRIVQRLGIINGFEAARATVLPLP